jgi:IclR family transcriptional regulator, acetate operon repressor
MEVKESPRLGGVQSVRRALDVLEAIGAAGEMGTSELARDLGLAVSTVHSLIRTLAARGYLVRSSNGYRLGPGVTVLASQWDPLSSLSPLLRPALRRLMQMTDHAATATIMVGDRARIVGYVPAPGLMTANADREHPINPFTLATGTLLVAMTRRADWKALAARQEGKPEWSVDDWLAELGRVAETGVCLKRARDARGQELTALGVPVYGPGDAVVCSIGCSMTGHTEMDDLKRTLDALWEVAADLGTAIGGRMPLPRPSVPRWSGG